MSKRHLLIIAHGSRRAASNDEVRRLGSQVEHQRGQAIGAVSVAFLELAEPGIPAALDRCAEQGAREIIVLPYFLAAGTHVAQDIPKALAAFRDRHPEIALRLAPHLGDSAMLPWIILDLAASFALP
jgi:sirohydrochlorin ferrochelatase